MKSICEYIKRGYEFNGPRPIPSDEIYRYGKYADKLLSIKPGLTGSWQTSGRSKLSC